MTHILQLMDLVVNRGVGLSAVTKLLLFITPSFLMITIPISLLIGILVALGRLSRDNEITVLKSSGLSLYQLLPPIVAASCAALAITSAMSFFLVPYGNLATKTLLFDLMQRRASLGIKEKVFNDDFKGLMIYANTIPAHGGYMEELFIADSRLMKNPTTITASRGYLFSDPESRAFVLRLVEGSTHTVDTESKVYKRMDFSSYDVRLDLEDPAASTAGSFHKSKTEMSLAELYGALGDQNLPELRRREHVIEMHKRFAMPAAALVFGLLGLSLGIGQPRSGKSKGFVIGLAVIVVYYVMQLTGDALGEMGALPLVAATWGPDCILFMAGLVLLTMKAREISPAFFLHGLLRHRGIARRSNSGAGRKDRP